VIRDYSQLTGQTGSDSKCLINAVVSMGRRNTELKV